MKIGNLAKMSCEALPIGSKAKAVCVYFIRAGKTGPIKIGIARDVLDRARGLQVGNHRPLRILATIPHEGETREAEMHKRFAGDRMHGEWFRASRGLLSYIIREAKEWHGEQIRLLRVGRPPKDGTTASRQLNLRITPELEGMIADYQSGLEPPADSESDAVRTMIVDAWTAKYAKRRKPRANP